MVNDDLFGAWAATMLSKTLAKGAFDKDFLRYHGDVALVSILVVPSINHHYHPHQVVLREVLALQLEQRVSRILSDDSAQGITSAANALKAKWAFLLKRSPATVSRGYMRRGQCA